MDKAALKGFIAKRVARELKDGDLVNLGIGVPTLVPEYLPEGVDVILQSENGVIGVGKLTPENTDPKYVTNAGGRPAAVAIGGAIVHSVDSFALIRGGHVDVTVLGSLEVDQEGSLANWMTPGNPVGMGGAMDLVTGAKKVIVAMEHTAKGKHKILEKCTLPYTAKHCVSQIVTEMCVFNVTKDGLHMIEINPEFSVEDVRAATSASFTVAEPLGDMSV